MRFPGWEAALEEHINRSLNEPFEWGSADCLLFVSDAAYLVSGIDPMRKKFKDDPETIRGGYSSEEEAFFLIKELRGSLPKIMDCHFDRIPPGFAQRGDIVLAKINQTHCFGIVGSGGALFKSQGRGFVTLPREKCKLAWRV